MSPFSGHFVGALYLAATCRQPLLDCPSAEKVGLRALLQSLLHIKPCDTDDCGEYYFKFNMIASKNPKNDKYAALLSVGRQENFLNAITGKPLIFKAKMQKTQ